MHHLIYLSTATRELTDLDIVSIVQHARLANAEQQITGALVYGNQQFLQILEGEEAAIHALYARIEQDPRHTRIVKFADKAIAQRSFTEWSMAFQYLSTDQFAGLAGVAPLADFDWVPPGLSEADKGMLQTVRSFIVPA